MENRKLGIVNISEVPKDHPCFVFDKFTKKILQNCDSGSVICLFLLIFVK